MPNFKSRHLLFLSFLEGGAVMVCELIGAKLLAPFFGTSLYVWAAVLALTLGGLTVGYYMGGRLSKKYDGSFKLLYIILSLAGLLLVLMPFTSDWIMGKTISLDLEIGAIISLFFFMFPPLVLMGMVSPVIINLLTQEATSAGNNAGNVYAISTTGGILATFLMGFLVIPNYGLTVPAIVSGVILSIIPLVKLLSIKKGYALVIAALLIAFSFLSWTPSKVYNDEYEIIYQSEGILGQVKVVDHPSYDITPDGRMGRGLVVNNTLQTYVGLDDNLQYSIWSWANYFPTAASIYPPKSKVLLLGLGGGTLVKQLNKLGFQTDVVEIDKRIKDVSFDYFNLDPSTNVVIDDARHYVRTTSNRYDIVIYDTFLSESVPEHLLTIEGIEDAKHILKKDGMIMINFYGFTSGEKGRAARSVFRTLSESHLYTDVLATPGEESNRNLIFLASGNPLDFSETRYVDHKSEKIEDIESYFLNPRDLHDVHAVVLSDKKPRLSKLYVKAAREWKKSYNAYYKKYFLKK